MNRLASTTRVLACATALTLSACGDDGGAGAGDSEAEVSTGADTDTGTETGGDGDMAVSIAFGAKVGDADASCGATYDNIGTEASTIELRDFRFYVSEIELLHAGGATPLTLNQDGLWQYENLALLDFEDASGLCQDSGTAETNTAVTGTVANGDYTGVRFTLGVPFAHNHQDVDAAPAPLNLPSMFWVWAGGYKFVRVDFQSGEVPWNLHLGSTGCTSDDPMAPPAEACARPNRLTVTLDSFDWETDTIVLDMGSLLADVDVSLNTMDTAPGCMSAPDDPECVDLFPELGLSLTDGQCTNDCGDQKAFRVQ